jgi:tetratricopeptide (TPR) repeat protein/transglutaminase-like putative cysteine protease
MRTAVPLLALRHFVLCFLSPVLSCVVVSECRAQENTQPWNAKHFSVSAKDLYQAASAGVTADGANIALFDFDESFTFDEAGRLTHVGHYIYKVLTSNGAEGWDTLSVGWDPWHEMRPVIRARVIEPDYSEHNLDPGAITEEPARGGDYKTYGDGKRLRAPLPAIGPGAVVEEEFLERETEPFFPPGRVGRAFFGHEQVPLAHSSAVFEAPSSLPLRIEARLLPGVIPKRAEVNGLVTITYEIGSLEAVESHDANLPSDVYLFPEIDYSTGASWQALATEYSKIVDSKAKADSVQSIVEGLISGKSTQTEKMAAIVDYVDQQVRYTGIEFGEAAIMPHSPAETLALKYGDCKDKATLLVAMLRAAGIPSYVALLNAGSRLDVPAELPGMGLFDHAIVYVPGNPAVHPSVAALWIDATDQYARVGQLPINDQGRRALIARPESTALTITPESTSRENVLLEHREIRLGDNGPATVVEKTVPTGVFESHYRAFYADKPNKETREGLTAYVKAQYMADKLTSVERNDPGDLSTQFELTLQCDKARRGYTDLDSAVAAIRVDTLFQQLPEELKRKEDTDKKKDDQDKPKKPRTADWELDQPFTAEWRYKIVPPAGFVPKELPKNEKIAMGPAVLTETFLKAKDGTVEATLTFDSGKRRYTVAEATEVRNKVAEVVAGPAIFVSFEPEGEALLHEGKVKEALASYRGLIAANPNDPLHHLQAARVMMQAGMGEAARAEAREAVKLDPNSALAERTLADILKHDLVGRDLRPGTDWAGAAEAYRAAARLDPEEHTAQANLAILLEYDSAGRRYSGKANLKQAVLEYEKLGQDKLAELQIPNNLPYAKFYSGDAEGAIKSAQTLNPQPVALIAASRAVMQGSKEGMAEINKLSTSDSAFKETARTTGEMLMNTRHYALAADFLQAGAGGDNAAQTMGLAAMLRDAKRHEDLQFANTPTDLVKHVFVLTMDPDLTEAKLMALASRNAVATMQATDPDDVKKSLDAAKKLNSQLARNGNSLDVTLDLMLQAFDPKTDGNDTTGYREKVQIPGGPNLTFFVVKEGGQYKLLEDTVNKPNSIALEMLDRIKAGDLNGAKVLLDWIREDQHLGGGDDTLAGPVFPRFWIKGEAADAQKMTLAAASLMVGTKPTAAQGVKLLEDARKGTTTNREMLNIEIALAEGYAELENFAKLFEVASELVKEVPESRSAFMTNVEALMGLKRYDEALALADARLKLLDDDADALQAKVQIEASRANYVAARGWIQKLIDQGKGNAGLLNSMAWFSLYTGKVDQADVATATKAAQMDQNSPAILHTLACVYAETGKTKEAHDLLLRAMDELNLDEPDDDYWYAFGRIAEQYGERDVAISDYRKLAKPKDTILISTSSYRLAQNRTKAMASEETATGK